MEWRTQAKLAAQPLPIASLSATAAGRLYLTITKQRRLQIAPRGIPPFPVHPLGCPLRTAPPTTCASTLKIQSILQRPQGGNTEHAPTGSKTKSSPTIHNEAIRSLVSSAYGDRWSSYAVFAGDARLPCYWICSWVVWWWWVGDEVWSWRYWRLAAWGSFGWDVGVGAFDGGGARLCYSLSCCLLRCSPRLLSHVANFAFPALFHVALARSLALPAGGLGGFRLRPAMI